jgi:hypothetical protein
MLDSSLAEAVYGPAARELTLPGRVAEKFWTLYDVLIIIVRLLRMSGDIVNSSFLSAACKRISANITVVNPEHERKPDWKVVFVYYAYENQGSELDLQAYTRAAHELGHEVIIYGKPRKKIPLKLFD